MIGFDDLDWAEHTAPALTTVKVYKRRIGRAGRPAAAPVEMLGGESEAPLRTTVATSLIVRSSACSCLNQEAKQSKVATVQSARRVRRGSCTNGPASASTRTWRADWTKRERVSELDSYNPDLSAYRDEIKMRKHVLLSFVLLTVLALLLAGCAGGAHRPRRRRRARRLVRRAPLLPLATRCKSNSPPGRVSTRPTDCKRSSTS